MVRWHKRGLLPADWGGDAGDPNPVKQARSGKTKMGKVAKKATRPAGPSSEGDDLDPLVGLARTLDAMLAEGLEGHDDADLALEMIGRCGLAGMPAPLMRELRSAVKAQLVNNKDRRDAPKVSAERVVIVSQAGATLVDAFDRIVCDKRRAKALKAIAKLLAEDLEKLPSVDPLGVL